MHSVALFSLEPLILAAVEAVGYVFWGMRLQKKGASFSLRVYIDKTGGVNVEDCTKASHQITGVLAANGMDTRTCSLEVSSPGLDRPLFNLEQYRSFIGHKVDLHLTQPHDHQQNFKGVIESIDLIKNQLVLNINTDKKKTFKTVTLLFQHIKSGHIVPDYF